MKVSDMTGAALDWAVAKCEGIENGYGMWLGTQWLGIPYSTEWVDGGPLMEGAGIGVWMYEWNDQGEPEKGWYAEDAEGNHVRRGDTPLIAAMRCYVASKLGEDIDLPEELQ